METSSGKGSGMDPVANTTSFDVVIIGAGIVGAAAFRELCKYDLKVLLLDSLHDVGFTFLELPFMLKCFHRFIQNGLKNI